MLRDFLYADVPVFIDEPADKSDDFRAAPEAGLHEKGLLVREIAVYQSVGDSRLPCHVAYGHLVKGLFRENPFSRVYDDVPPDLPFTLFESLEWFFFVFLQIILR